MGIRKIINAVKDIKISNTIQSEEGKIGYILAWMVGIPIPVLLLIFFIRGCD